MTLADMVSLQFAITGGAFSLFVVVMVALISRPQRFEHSTLSKILKMRTRALSSLIICVVFLNFAFLASASDPDKVVPGPVLGLFMTLFAAPVLRFAYNLVQMLDLALLSGE